MTDPLDATRTAVRVIHAVIAGHAPSQLDIEALTEFAPSLAEKPPDELACDVIQRARKQREQVSRSGGGG